MPRLSLYRAIWVWSLVVTVVAVVATAIPLLGLIFIVFGAQYLPTLLLNVAFVAMALDALTSRAYLLLVLPVLWFGGYGSAAFLSHSQVAKLRSEVAASNSHAPAKWNRSSQPVQIEKSDTSSENLASDIRPDALVQVYGLNQAYQGSFADAPTQQVTLAGYPCPKRGISVSGSIQYHPIHRGGYPSKTPMQWAQDVCMIYQSHATLPATPLKVELAPARRFSGLIDGIEQDITISGPDQQPYTLRSLQVAALPWLPMPVMGCHYKGGLGDSWDRGCHAEFSFTSWRGQDENVPMAVLARALGLKALTIEERLPRTTWE